MTVAAIAHRVTDRIKLAIRLLEARLTPRTHAVSFANQQLRFVRSLWWDDAHQSSFDVEIRPYFDVLPIGWTPKTILDAGAATGLFAVAACRKFPSATVYGFEPSSRQRVMMGRNAVRNGVDGRVNVVPAGLWTTTTELSFRTHGSISALEAAESLPHDLPFIERVPVVSLDEWTRQNRIESLDLIKMDIEGAEVEALQGGVHTLKRFHPLLLIQAYHLRGGIRTLEPCAALLRDLGYETSEVTPASGFLVATPQSRIGIQQ